MTVSKLIKIIVSGLIGSTVGGAVWSFVDLSQQGCFALVCFTCLSAFPGWCAYSILYRDDDNDR